MPKIAEIENKNLIADERGLTRMRKKSGSGSVSMRFIVNAIAPKLPKLPKIAEIEKQNLTADERGLTRMRKKGSGSVSMGFIANAMNVCLKARDSLANR